MTSTLFLSRLRFNRPLYNFSSAKQTQTLRLLTIPTRRTLFLDHMLCFLVLRGGGGGGGYNNLNVNVNVTSGSAFDILHLATCGSMLRLHQSLKRLGQTITLPLRVFCGRETSHSASSSPPSVTSSSAFDTLRQYFVF